MSIGPVEAVGEYWVTEAERRLADSQRQLRRHADQGRAQPVLVSDHLRVQSDRLAVAAAEKRARAEAEQAAADQARREPPPVAAGPIDVLA